MPIKKIIKAISGKTGSYFLLFSTGIHLISYPIILRISATSVYFKDSRFNLALKF